MVQNFPETFMSFQIVPRIINDWPLHYWKTSRNLKICCNKRLGVKIVGGTVHVLIQYNFGIIYNKQNIFNYWITSKTNNLNPKHFYITMLLFFVSLLLHLVVCNLLSSRQGLKLLFSSFPLSFIYINTALFTSLFIMRSLILLKVHTSPVCLPLLCQGVF